MLTQLFEISIPLRPVSVNAMYVQTGRRVVKSPEARVFQQKVAELAAEKRREMEYVQEIGKEQDLVVCVDFRLTKGYRVDLDNCLKTLLDALQTAGVFPNDRQIVGIHTRRFIHQAEDRINVSLYAAPSDLWAWGYTA